MEVEFMTADTPLPPCMPLSVDRVSSQQPRKGHVRPDVGYCFCIRHRGHQWDFIYPFPHRGTGGGTCPQHHDREAFPE